MSETIKHTRLWTEAAQHDVACTLQRLRLIEAKAVAWENPQAMVLDTIDSAIKALQGARKMAGKLPTVRVST